MGTADASGVRNRARAEAPVGRSENVSSESTIRHPARRQMMMFSSATAASINRRGDHSIMFIVYGVHQDGRSESKHACPTLDAALLELRNLISLDLVDPAGAQFVSYVVKLEASDGAR